jgi:hypothetical protein
VPASSGLACWVRLRRSTLEPDAVTGYAVGLPQHTASGGGVIWYSGGKLAADLTLPKLRARWTTNHAGQCRLRSWAVAVRGAGCALEPGHRRSQPGKR